MGGCLENWYFVRTERSSNIWQRMNTTEPCSVCVWVDGLLFVSTLQVHRCLGRNRLTPRRQQLVHQVSKQRTSVPKATREKCPVVRRLLLAILADFQSQVEVKKERGASGRAGVQGLCSLWGIGLQAPLRLCGVIGQWLDSAGKRVESDNSRFCQASTADSKQGRRFHSQLLRA